VTVCDNKVNHRRLSQRSYSVKPLRTWMGDCLQVGKPSRHLASHLGQLSLPSFRGRYIKYQLAWLGLRRGAFTCISARWHCV